MILEIITRIAANNNNNNNNEHPNVHDDKDGVLVFIHPLITSMILLSQALRLRPCIRAGRESMCLQYEMDDSE